MIYLQSNLPILKMQFQGISYIAHTDVSQNVEHPLTSKMLCSVNSTGGCFK